eukprot:NODE_7753_length_1553_cov_4.458626.p1 GENE.NODE_7753_length_1553_cov_4.458626~~NODE_7753_length_1553_cov_4.458626.p1  ORF type:complete len:427 (-),score=121.38 NODE_7753_length_1553_cov_4.458626:271-1482(-)
MPKCIPFPKVPCLRARGANNLAPAAGVAASTQEGGDPPHVQPQAEPPRMHEGEGAAIFEAHGDAADAARGDAAASSSASAAAAGPAATAELPAGSAPGPSVACELPARACIADAVDEAEELPPGVPVEYASMISLLLLKPEFFQTAIAQYQFEALSTAFAHMHMAEDMRASDMHWTTELIAGCQLDVDLAFSSGEGTVVKFKLICSGFQCDTLQLFALALYPTFWHNIVPFLQEARKATTFAFNDWLLELFVSIPVPLFPKLHNVSQVSFYDVLDTDLKGVLAVLRSPTEGSWRGVPVPPVMPGAKRVNKEEVTFLVQPEPEGMHTITLNGKMDIPVPRWLLSGRVVEWIVNFFARTAVKQALAALAAFQGSEFEKCMQEDAEVFERMREHLITLHARTPVSV